MISIITSTCNTPPDVLARTWASLKSQTHTDWEWVVIDDSTVDTVWHQLYGFCADERYKVRVFKPHVPSRGNIGSVKRDAFMLGRGDILLELDHDDELTPDCLEEVQKAFDNNPSAGFVYSDWCEILPNGMSGKYPEGWAFGYGSERWNMDYGVWVMDTPPINRTTISHIVSAPNHVRAWSADFYRSIGGHNPEIEIADDYELMVRTVLKTDTVHIPKLLYKQHIGEHTSQRQKNGLIQAIVAEVAERYSAELSEKFPESP